MGKKNQPNRSTRFQPGRSGNPNGRPRKIKAPQMESPFDVLNDRRIDACIDGVNRELTIDEAILHRTYLDALDGSPMAIRSILNEIIEHDAKRAPQGRRFPKISCEFPDPAHVDEALVILGIAVPSTDAVRSDGRRNLQLASWAVKRGLGRKRSTAISDKDVKELKTHTADSDAVNWRRGGDE